MLSNEDGSSFQSTSVVMIVLHIAVVKEEVIVSVVVDVWQHIIACGMKEQ